MNRGNSHSFSLSVLTTTWKWVSAPTVRCLRSSARSSSNRARLGLIAGLRGLWVAVIVRYTLALIPVGVIDVESAHALEDRVYPRPNLNASAANRSLS